MGPSWKQQCREGADLFAPPAAWLWLGCSVPLLLIPWAAAARQNPSPRQCGSAQPGATSCLTLLCFPEEYHPDFFTQVPSLAGSLSKTRHFASLRAKPQQQRGTAGRCCMCHPLLLMHCSASFLQAPRNARGHPQQGLWGRRALPRAGQVPGPAPMCTRTCVPCPEPAEAASSQWKTVSSFTIMLPHFVSTQNTFAC